jgi:amino acid transporter
MSEKNVKRLSTLDIFCLGINAIIGSGIFLFPGILAKEAGPASVLAFLVCGLLLVFVALCYAELGSIFRQNGGSYVYAREAYGPLAGFTVGWISWITAICSWAAVANAVGFYMTFFGPAFENYYVSKCLALLLVLTFGFINYRGIKLGAWTVDAFTLAKLLPLLMFVLVGLFFIEGSNYHYVPVPQQSNFAYAVFLALWALQGFEVTPLPAGESCNPRTAVPRAAIGSLLVCTCLYACIQAVAVGTYGESLASTSRPLAEACSSFMGPLGGLIISLGAVISIIGYNAGNALGSPRFLSAIAEDRFLPHYFSEYHPRFFTPSRAILLTTGLTSLAALLLNYENLVNLSNFAVVIQYLATCSAVIVLRHRKPGLNRAFTIPYGQAVALAGCAISLWLLWQVRLQEFLLGCFMLMCGLVCRALTHRKSLRASAACRKNI